MNELWRQPAAKPDPVKVRQIKIKDDPEGFHAETMRLIAARGYCLWRCHDIPGQPVVAVVESLGNYHGRQCGPYPGRAGGDRMRTCRLCGRANEDREWWVLKDLCIGCVEGLSEEDSDDGRNLLIPKDCRHCDLVLEEMIGHFGKCVTCSLGRFGKDQWFAVSGIDRPNKTVARAQFQCPEFKVHRRWRR